MAKAGMSESDSDGSNAQAAQSANANLTTESIDVVSPSDQQLQNVASSVNATAEVVTAASKVQDVHNPIVQTSMPISIVIQSLVQNLCFNYEHDDEQVQAMYLKICEMLYKMMVIDDSYLMSEFEGIRNQCQRAFHHLLTASRGDSQTVLAPMWSNDVCNEWSHYKREFQELEFIAKGGFGRVYRVRHKLDDTEYAVKKIFIRSNSIESVKNYLAEVKTFASLNHSNIVQYKAAWLELGANANSLEDSSDEEFEESQFSSESKEDALTTSFCQNNPDFDYDYQRESSEFICFENSRHYSLTNSTRYSKRKEMRVKRNSTSEGGNAICNVEEIRRLQTRSHPKWATLFIQMSLCHTTLKQWLEKRNLMESSNPGAILPVNCTRKYKQVIEILKQILTGLEYIHSKNIVHHDIKPSNIFMQFENNRLLVQLGDFGLACPLQATQHSLAGGTKLYAAPEQLAGMCNSKSDLYSLGIVVFELTETFLTDMERVTNISNLRKGQLPQSTLQQQPELSEIISQLVVRQSSARPDAATLLKRINENEQALDNAIVREMKQNFEAQLAERDAEITRLKREIERLRLDSAKSDDAA